jgi:hypothetical protein
MTLKACEVVYYMAVWSSDVTLEADDKLQVWQLTFHFKIFPELFLAVTGNQID